MKHVEYTSFSYNKYNVNTLIICCCDSKTLKLQERQFYILDIQYVFFSERVVYDTHVVEAVTVYPQEPKFWK